MNRDVCSHIATGRDGGTDKLWGKLGPKSLRFTFPVVVIWISQSQTSNRTDNKCKVFYFGAAASEVPILAMAEEPPPARGDHKAFTPAERIAELNDVDKSVASLLKSASSAISILANAPSSDSKPTLASQQAAFTSHSDAFFSTLSSIDVRLRRQVYALEEAGLIPPGDERRDAKRGTAFASEEVNRAGNGPLDASWLNARASDGVSKGMEREIWAQARGFVERLKEKKAEGGIEEESKADEGGDMEVDAKDGEDAPAAT